MVNKLYLYTQLITGFSVCYSSTWAGNQGLWCISKISSMEKTKLNTRTPQHFNWEKRPHSPWNSPGQNTGVGSISLLQGIFPTQGSNPGLPHCWQILYQLSHKGSPLILEWVAYPFSSRSSWPRNWTGVPCIAGGFFTNWALGEAPQFRGETYEQFF